MSTIAFRFWRYVQEGDPDECWLWTGTLNAAGYGVLQVGTRKKPRVKLAHRIAYEQSYGPLPANVVIRHQCHTRACVNARHMLTGSRADNVQDAVRARRQAREFDFPYTKLSDAQIRELRAAYEAGATQRELAARYGIHKVYVGSIVRREKRLGADDMTR